MRESDIRLRLHENARKVIESKLAHYRIPPRTKHITSRKLCLSRAEPRAFIVVPIYVQISAHKQGNTTLKSISSNSRSLYITKAYDKQKIITQNELEGYIFKIQSSIHNQYYRLTTCSAHCNLKQSYNVQRNLTLLNYEMFSYGELIRLQRELV